MRPLIRPVRAGSIHVSLFEGHIIECRASGYLTEEVVRAAQGAMDTILAEREGVFDTLLDGRAIDSFERGLPGLWFRWSMPKLHRFRRSAILASTAPMLGVGRVFRYLLPTLTFGFFMDRDEGMRFLRGSNPGAPPVARGTQMRGSGKQSP